MEDKKESLRNIKKLMKAYENAIPGVRDYNFELHTLPLPSPKGKGRNKNRKHWEGK